jgi:hypothetical protein
MKQLLIYLFIACFFSACKNIVTPPLSTEKLDTISTVPARITAQPLLLESAFVKGTTQVVNNATINFYGVNIGKLKIPTGRIIACDPYLIEEYGNAFTQVFPTGEFPMQLAIAKFDNGEQLAFARIQFSDAPVAKWEVALLKDQKPVAVNSEKKHGYVVDAGLGIFMDEAAKAALDKNLLVQPESALYKEMEKHYHHRWRHAVYNFGNHNLAAFSTGFGDGRYVTYIGFDDSGKPCRLVTDFEIVDWQKK